MPDGEFLDHEKRAAEWLYNRVMLEREIFNKKEGVKKCAFKNLPEGEVRNSWLREGREMAGVVHGETGVKPRAVHGL
jgi:hypothetical protein